MVPSISRWACTLTKWWLGAKEPCTHLSKCNRCSFNRSVLSFIYIKFPVCLFMIHFSDDNLPRIRGNPRFLFLLAFSFLVFLVELPPFHLEASSHRFYTVSRQKYDNCILQICQRNRKLTKQSWPASWLIALFVALHSNHRLSSAFFFFFCDVRKLLKVCKNV